MNDQISPERLAEIHDRIPPGDHPWRLEPRIVVSGLDEWEQGFEIWTAIEDGDHLVAEVHDEFDPADEECDGESGIISVQIDATHDIHPNAKGVADFILHARDDMVSLLAEVDRLTAELAKATSRVAELEELGIERHAEMLVDEVRLRSLEIRNGGFKMEMEEARDLAAIYVACARTMLGDAPNYSETPIEFHVKVAEEPEKYILTVQRTSIGAMTPHELRQQAEADRDRLAAELAEAREANQIMREATTRRRELSQCSIARPHPPHFWMAARRAYQCMGVTVPTAEGDPA